MCKCIYCFSSDDLSDSHIIPESLGGSEELKGFVCKKCNDEFGRTFEATVANELSFYRFIITELPPFVKTSATGGTARPGSEDRFQNPPIT